MIGRLLKVMIPSVFFDFKPIYYLPHPKDGEGNVFDSCLYVHGGWGTLLVLSLVLFQVLSGREYPLSCLGIPPVQGRGALFPVLRYHLDRMGVYTPLDMMGSTPFPGQARRGRYATCGHADGFSCYYSFSLFQI